MMFVAPSGRHIGMLEVEGKEGREGGAGTGEREKAQERERVEKNSSTNSILTTPSFVTVIKEYPATTRGFSRAQSPVETLGRPLEQVTVSAVVFLGLFQLLKKRYVMRGLVFFFSLYVRPVVSRFLCHNI